MAGTLLLLVTAVYDGYSRKVATQQTFDQTVLDDLRRKEHIEKEELPAIGAANPRENQYIRVGYLLTAILLFTGFLLNLGVF